jgi:flagellar L-ring protein FlgH
MKCCKMPRNSFNRFPSPERGISEGRARNTPRRRPPFQLLSGCALLLFATTAMAKKPRAEFPAAVAAAPVPPPANGAIFQIGGYTPLTSGMRASQVGDVLTIMLVERTSATKSNSANTDRSGDISVTPPASGPLSLIKPKFLNSSGAQSFKGQGDAAQSNALSGEVSVTVAAVYPNGTMLVRGEKLLTLNRGDERLQMSGIVRAADISPDNKTISTRVADAKIRYIGKGEVARASRQGWLQRFFSKVSPF